MKTLRIRSRQDSGDVFVARRSGLYPCDHAWAGPHSELLQPDADHIPHSSKNRLIEAVLSNRDANDGRIP